ncbi:unnamed protein product [Rotaria sp. Silwood1]|nr:unnamed protein product [Rotaria sp. Silwood1]
MKNKLKLHRGKMIPREELENFQKSEGRFVVTNSFVSTTTEEIVALSFVGGGTSEATDKVSVIFYIQIDIEKNYSKPVAFIRECSQHPDEEEVLLSMGIVLSIVVLSTVLPIILKKQQSTDDILHITSTITIPTSFVRKLNEIIPVSTANLTVTTTTSTRAP